MRVMDANEPRAALPSPRDGRSRWLAVVSGQARGPLAALARSGLAILAGLYRGGLASADLRWRLPGLVKHATTPVISIGNLTVGGTGKTPMAAYLARVVMEAGGRPLIVSRGYGANEGPNEEARELARLCPAVPHIQDPDRLRAITGWAASHPCEVAILDDGFQHRRLARDLDIVLVDALQPFGFGHVLPRGLLREPASALRRADLVVITRADLVGRDELDQLKETVARRARPGTPVLVARHVAGDLVRLDGSRRSADRLRGQDIAAACGIGNPDAFRRTLEALGARVRLFHAFPDHHAYTRGDIDGLVQAARAAGLKTLVTTGKDYVKWTPLTAGQATTADPDIAALEVTLRIVDGEEVLRSRIAALLAGSAR